MHCKFQDVLKFFNWVKSSAGSNFWAAQIFQRFFCNSMRLLDTIISRVRAKGLAAICMSLCFVLGFGPVLGKFAGASEASVLELSNVQRPLIVATTGQVGDMVRNIVGNVADVQILLGPGSDPHLHQLTRRETALLARADIIVANGFHLEAQMARSFVRLKASGKAIIEVADLLPVPRRLVAEEIVGAVYDPHIWLDAENWAIVSEKLATQLAVFLPQYADVLELQLRDWAGQLRMLDSNIRQVFSTIPAGSRVLVTSHDAFRYLGQAYGLEVVGIQGLSTETQAGLKAIEALVRRIAGDQTPAVFTETTVSDRNIQALMKGVAARGGQVRLGGTLYSDAMGPEGSGAETYLEMMRHNARVITNALGGHLESMKEGERQSAGLREDKTLLVEGDLSPMPAGSLVK